MGTAGIDPLRPFLHEGIGRPHEGSPCIYDVVKNDRDVPIDIADDVQSPGRHWAPLDVYR